MDHTADFTTTRRWTALVFLAFMIGLMVFGWLNGEAHSAPLEVNAAPSQQPAPVGTMSARQRLAWLNECGMPGHVGAHRPEHSVCQPSVVWPLAEFAAQLVKLQVLAEGHQLVAASDIAGAQCPLVVLDAGNAFRGRLCFGAEGSVYRELDQGAASWRWGYALDGQWVLERATLAVAESR
jgi:hypothetical protein